METLSIKRDITREKKEKRVTVRVGRVAIKRW